MYITLHNTMTRKHYICPVLSVVHCLFGVAGLLLLEIKKTTTTITNQENIV